MTMNVTNFFERIYIVNLPERTDRRREMERELYEQGLSPRDRRVRFFPAIRPLDAGKFPSLGARGCFMSHLAILDEALRDALANVLVMEDDLSIDPRFKGCQTGLLSHLAANRWDFAYFGHVETLLGESAAPVWLSSRQPTACTHFYALNQPVIPRLHEHLNACLGREPGHPDGSPMHVDGAYSLFRTRHPEVVTLMAAPSLGSQRSSRSDVFPNRWYDRTPLLRDLAGLARRGKNWRRQLGRVRGQSHV